MQKIFAPILAAWAIAATAVASAAPLERKIETFNREVRFTCSAKSSRVRMEMADANIMLATQNLMETLADRRDKNALKKLPPMFMAEVIATRGGATRFQNEPDIIRDENFFRIKEVRLDSNKLDFEDSNAILMHEDNEGHIQIKTQPNTTEALAELDKPGNPLKRNLEELKILSAQLLDEAGDLAEKICGEVRQRPLPGYHFPTNGRKDLPPRMNSAQIQADDDRLIHPKFIIGRAFDLMGLPQTVKAPDLRKKNMRTRARVMAR